MKIKWIEINLPWVQYPHNDGGPIIKEDSFCARELDKPGVLVETDYGLELIGTINMSSGICDCCASFDEKTIIKRYAVVFSPKEYGIPVDFYTVQSSPTEEE